MKKMYLNNHNGETIATITKSTDSYEVTAASDMLLRAIGWVLQNGLNARRFQKIPKDGDTKPPEFVEISADPKSEDFFTQLKVYYELSFDYCVVIEE